MCAAPVVELALEDEARVAVVVARRRQQLVHRVGDRQVGLAQLVGAAGALALAAVDVLLGLEHLRRESRRERQAHVSVCVA